MKKVKVKTTKQNKTSVQVTKSEALFSHGNTEQAFVSASMRYLKEGVA